MHGPRLLIPFRLRGHRLLHPVEHLSDLGPGLLQRRHQLPRVQPQPRTVIRHHLPRTRRERYQLAFPDAARRHQPWRRALARPRVVPTRVQHNHSQLRWLQRLPHRLLSQRSESHPLLLHRSVPAELCRQQVILPVHRQPVPRIVEERHVCLAQPLPELLHLQRQLLVTRYVL